MAETVAAIIARETRTPVPAAVAAVTDAAIALFPQGSILAALFYGSCLRDGITTGRLVDLYLLADSYRQAHPGRLAALANRLVPPNVYYVECAHGGETVRAKLALVTLDQLERLVGSETDNPYFWARFSQPAGIVTARDDQVRQRIEKLLAAAVRTMAAQARGLGPPDPGRPQTLFVQGFAATYQTELRSEPPGRAAQIVAVNADRYAAMAAELLPQLPDDPARAATWLRRRWLGKLWSVARLAKAAFTFKGGLDYLAWKIERHSGVRIEVTPWKRRHPIIGAIMLFASTRRRGGFR